MPNLEKVEFFVDERILQEPLKQKKPCTIFVGDMFDLFHEKIPEEMIGHVFAAMAQCPQHTFQVLTKRADEMLDLLSHADAAYGPFDQWPLPNVWCGVSVEDQQRADERIQLLLQTPAAVRFLSVEPQLEAIDFEPESIDGMPAVNMLRGADWCDPPIPGIDWVICGGESGPGARPFNLAWAESLQAQCGAAGVPFFMKQVGSNPVATGSLHGLACTVFPNKKSKGGDVSEWPAHLRVREFPAVTHREAVTARTKGLLDYPRPGAVKAAEWLFL